MTRRDPFARAVLAPRIAPPSGGSMSYEDPAVCATCGHRGEMHEDWWKPKTKSCSQWSNGHKCECRAYVRSTT